MLNINDIYKRLETNPEPQEVKDTRNLITESFKDLEFVEDIHKYYIPQANGEKKELPSATTIIRQWEQEVDWDEKARLKALKLNIEVEDLKRQWHENNIISTSCGSKTHFFGENAMNMFIGREYLTKKNMPFQYTEDGYLIPYCPKEWAVSQYYTDILNNPDVYPVMPEAKLYMNYNDTFNIKNPYAGTFDILMAYRYNGEIVYSIHDFKGLPLDTPILTTKGFKKMAELEVGDYVYDMDGKPTRIINCSEIHNNNRCMKIIFDDGYSIISDFEHRWLITFNEHHNLKEVVMTTDELKSYVDDLNKHKIRPSHKIPKIYISKPLRSNNGNLPIDPYVLGVWLGDGHSDCGYVTNMYDDIFKEIERRGYKVGKNVDKNEHTGKAHTRCIFGLYTKLKKYNLIKNKHIPDYYITNSSYEQKLDILRGLMDTDGYYNKTRNRFIISTTRDTQVEYCVKLLTSLGIKPSVLKTKGSCTNCPNKKIFTRWDVCFTTDIYPFLIRDVKTKQPSNKKHLWRNIVSVENVKTVPTRCIEVDSDSHTYLADKMLLVTHNTNKDLYKTFSRNNGVMMLPPFDEMGFYEEPYHHYVIQLNLYQLGLMQLGLRIVDRCLIWLKEDGTYEKVKVPNITKKLLEML